MADQIDRPLAAPRMKMSFCGGGVEVRGIPDGIFRLKNGRVMIVDFKTGKPKRPGHPWYPWYAAQSCAYAHMYQEIYAEKVGAIYLVNAMIQSDKDSAADVESRREDGFITRFKIENVPIKLDFSVTPGLAASAHYCRDKEPPPPSRDKCKDCARMLEMVNTLEQAEASLDDAEDATMLPTYHFNDKWYIRTLC